MTDQMLFSIMTRFPTNYMPSMQVDNHIQI